MIARLSSDPPPSAGVPATTHALGLDSGGETLPTVLHLPAGRGPHAVAVLLHGFPGNERNFDLAQALRRAGYASVVFHYRGSWGAGGEYSWGNVLEDTRNVVQRLREDGLRRAHALDIERLALVGHSLGGFAALMTAAEDGAVAAAVSVAGFDMGAAAVAAADAEYRAGLIAAFHGELLPLRNTTAEALVDELVAAGGRWSLTSLAPRLRDRPVLLIGTSRDAVTAADFHHHPVAAALSSAESTVWPTDHWLSDHRIALAATVVDFLDRSMPAPP